MTIDEAYKVMQKHREATDAFLALHGNTAEAMMRWIAALQTPQLSAEHAEAREAWNTMVNALNAADKSKVDDDKSVIKDNLTTLSEDARFKTRSK